VGAGTARGRRQARENLNYCPTCWDLYIFRLLYLAPGCEHVYPERRITDTAFIAYSTRGWISCDVPRNLPISFILAFHHWEPSVPSPILGTEHTACGGDTRPPQNSRYYGLFFRFNNGDVPFIRHTQLPPTACLCGPAVRRATIFSTMLPTRLADGTPPSCPFFLQFSAPRRPACWRGVVLPNLPSVQRRPLLS